MVDTVESLAARLRKLEDINAIQELKNRYWRACDRKQPDVVRDCFRPDATIDAAFLGVHEGRDSFVGLFEMVGCRDSIIDMHHGQNPSIVLDENDPDKAHGTWDLFFYQINLDNRSASQAAGYYEDDYVRIDGRWWIQTSVFRVTSTQMTEVTEQDSFKVTMFGR
ncbi:nuclear transport factor 2 family protein [Zavarzinia compransoris]|uniref:nuclear transport factor 2 family protein n=1 Tax=Zavarzinia marina TaxID=2911065 RepID=UPI001F27550C|nr:nuclear transport factor 2 family protein [Zavarzinia marina]MCF4166200.1 nuclear transport factor 2 family protein [Zavarzinia marina]